MKKSSSVKLLFVTGLLAACTQKEEWPADEKTVYMRADSTASYSRSHGFAPGFFWYHAFRPYGAFHNGYYNRAGYYSDAISSKANIGRNTYKGSVARGSLGRSGFRASS